MLISKCISLSFPSGKLMFMFDGKESSARSVDWKVDASTTLSVTQEKSLTEALLPLARKTAVYSQST